MGRKPPRNKWKPLPGDIIILILGITGAGKSTFINTAARTGVATIGHSLDSSTDTVKPYEIPLPEDDHRRVVLVDTPGFDDSYQKGDTKTMEKITDWLKNTCGMETHVTGIILLHEIHRKQRLYHVLGKICLSGASRHVILATSKWADVADRACEERRRELASDFPRVAVRRFQRNRESAWALINELRAKPPVMARSLRDCLLSAVPPEKVRDSGIFAKLRKLFG